jgi:hypothetical protein
MLKNVFHVSEQFYNLWRSIEKIRFSKKKNSQTDFYVLLSSPYFFLNLALIPLAGNFWLAKTLLRNEK